MATSSEQISERFEPSSPGAAEAVASRPSLNQWILASRQDLLFFVGTPLVLLPLVALAEMRSGIAEFIVIVSYFGAVGHHLPGMIRAYADRELFKRFRMRFILSPLFLVSVCLFFAFRNLQGMTVILLLWGTWHFFMQVYGFARIYDAKVKSRETLTVWLDFLLCGSWFIAAELYSPGRLSDLLVTFYECGGPLLPPAGVHAVQIGWGVATAAITAAFLINHFMRVYNGEPTNFVKLLLLTTCIAYWWVLMVSIENIVLGIALFEIFHDIQYLAIVWVYNRNRVDQGRPVGSFTRFLFRRSGTMIGLYVGLVLAYGYLGFVGDRYNLEDGARVGYGLLIASSLLHFYFDGFIWKVREKSTSESLGLAGGEDSDSRFLRLPGWSMHGLKWAFFVVPVWFLYFSQTTGTGSLLERRENVAAIVTESAQSHNELAASLMDERRDFDRAIEHARRAVELDPNMAEAHHNLGLALSNVGRVDEAIQHYNKAIELNSEHPGTYVNLAIALRSQGKFPEVIAALEKALDLEPFDTSIQVKLADAMMSHSWILATDSDASRRNPDEALQLVQRATRLFPTQDPRIPDVVAAALAAKGDYDRAISNAEIAHQMAVRFHHLNLAEEIGRRLQLYRNKKPYVRLLEE